MKRIFLLAFTIVYFNAFSQDCEIKKQDDLILTNTFNITKKYSFGFSFKDKLNFIIKENNGINEINNLRLLTVYFTNGHVQFFGFVNDDVFLNDESNACKHLKISKYVVFQDFKNSTIKSILFSSNESEKIEINEKKALDFQKEFLCFIKDLDTLNEIYLSDEEVAKREKEAEIQRKLKALEEIDRQYKIEKEKRETEEKQQKEDELKKEEVLINQIKEFEVNSKKLYGRLYLGMPNELVDYIIEKDYYREYNKYKNSVSIGNLTYNIFPHFFENKLYKLEFVQEVKYDASQIKMKTKFYYDDLKATMIKNIGNTIKTYPYPSILDIKYAYLIDNWTKNNISYLILMNKEDYEYFISLEIEEPIISKKVLQNINNSINNAQDKNADF